VTPRDFPFIERPDAARLTQAIECLRDQRALEILNMPAVNAATGMKMGQILPDAVDDEPEIGPAPPVEHIEYRWVCVGHCTSLFIARFYSKF
jgi:hypothetical protein